MATLQLVDKTNQSAGEIEVHDALVSVPFHAGLVKEAIVYYRNSIRQGTHSTKERSEVAGSTKKLWRQKGTGRARVGNVKSPIWRHGGVAFGPKPRDYSIKMNKKARKKALCIALSEKFRQGQIIVIEQLEVVDHKTRNFIPLLQPFSLEKGLIVVDEISQNLALAAKNLPNIHVVNYQSLNVYKLLWAPQVLFVKSALLELEKRLLS